ncbi:MAG: triose-phosphate isomerase [Gemmatimonadota bacterium]|nr:triose-phosphate isomerase [Gemmatimonadota bacterium]
MRPLIAGNWKMHGLAQQLCEIERIAAFVNATAPQADVLICPPATLLARAAQTAAGRIDVGGQDCHWDIAGPFTGDVSAEMLGDAGASAVIVGHSERRQHHGETDAMVAAKATAARRAGLLAIIAVGETDQQRTEGEALSAVGAQIAGSVPRDIVAVAIAYEPLWAIGSGRTPMPGEIVEMHAHIRQELAATLGGRSRSVRILYGGSVNSANAREILSLPEVDGALVGGASLHADDFVGILSALTVSAPR